MAVTLNEDIFTLIYSYIFNFDVLRTATTAIAINKKHPLRQVVLRRLLQLPLRLSSEDLRGSKALIDHFARNPTQAGLVRDVAIFLGPSRRSIVENELFWGNVRHEDLEKAERGEALVEMLPKLLSHTENLRYLDWSRCPHPNRETLKELSEHSLISHLSLDCSVESYIIPNPPELLGPSTGSK